MKYSVRFFVVTFLLLICTYATAEQKIVYLDMKFVLNNSKAGKGAQDFLQKTFKENQKKFSDMENGFKKEEADLLSKKNDLSNEEYQKKSDALRKKVFEYQNQRRTSLEKITSLLGLYFSNVIFMNACPNEPVPPVTNIFEFFNIYPPCFLLSYPMISSYLKI